jgi:TM2 domain-containing membrane protein YozV
MILRIAPEPYIHGVTNDPYAYDSGEPANPYVAGQPGYNSQQPGYSQPGYAQPAGYGQPGYAAYPPPQQQFDAYGRPLSDKSKVVAGVLGIALGGFGVGRFYIGDTRTGVLMLLVTFFTCGIGHIWGLVDGIMILVNGGVDAQGRVLRD